MPERIAFRMNLYPGQAREYREAPRRDLPRARAGAEGRRHLRLHDLARPETNHLFGILTRADDHTLDPLPDTEIMKRWWKHMADIMETNATNVPVQIPLKRVFYLP